jgi:flagellar hook-associated protein 3 FlgL
MRITGNRMLELAAAATGKAQRDVAEISDQLSSGKRVDRPSADPVAWAQARRAEIRRAASEGRGEALAFGKDQLVLTEQALGTISDALAESHEAAIQAANDSLTPEQRAGLAVRIAGLFQAALGAANTRTVAGEYVLGGSASTTPPFDANGNFVGDNVQRSLELDNTTTAPSTMTGEVLTAAQGGVEVLPMMSRFIAALNSNDMTAIRASVAELDAAHEQTVRARTDAGAMFGVLDEADRARGSFENHMTSQIASLVETDVVAAASELSRSAGALNAAQAVNSKLAALLSPAR